jgi:hypothetical protein
VLDPFLGTSNNGTEEVSADIFYGFWIIEFSRAISFSREPKDARVSG